MIGRPTKYKEEYNDTVIELMKQGASIEEIALELDVHKSTLYEWMDKHKEFSDSIKKGVNMSEGWWMKQGRTNLKEKEFNYTGWYMNMKNRFGWKDRTDHTTNEKDITPPIKWE